MLSKCANPSCSATFLYLSHGKLFRMESTSGNESSTAYGANPDTKKNNWHLEFFWLCDQCANAVTLAYTKGHRITTQPLTQAEAAASSEH